MNLLLTLVEGEGNVSHTLLKDSFVCKSDVRGRQYVTLNFNEADNTHHGIDSRELEMNFAHRSHFISILPN